MYVSSKNLGTCPSLHLDSDGFQKLQWNLVTIRIGKLVKQKLVDLPGFSCNIGSGQRVDTDSEAVLTAALARAGFGISQMSSDNHRKEKSHHSDPVVSLTPLLDDLLSGSHFSLTRSISPRKESTTQCLEIRMDLTEGQMDNLTNTFSYGLHGSPARHSSPARTRARAAGLTPRSSPRRSNRRRTENRQLARMSSDVNTNTESPTFSELIPGHDRAYSNDLSPNTLAERRYKGPPSPLELRDTTYQLSEVQRLVPDPAPQSVSPLSDNVPTQSRFSGIRVSFDAPSSIYSQEAHSSARPDPLELRKFGHQRSGSKFNDTTADSCRDWAESRTPSPSKHTQSQLDRRPRRSKSTGEGLRLKQHSELEPSFPPIMSKERPLEENGPQFSPLQLYFRGSGFPSDKKGEKILIGDNGWLERTEETPDKVKKTTPKKAGIIEGIKKIAKDMADFHTTRRLQNSSRERPSLQVSISLNSREQSLLYCELEFQLSSALNDYITVQLDKGRLDPDKLKRVADGWQQKGRPKVVGFRYDLETQLELVNLHVDEFRFYGRRQGDPVEICGLLHAMKVNARALSVRTFCQPDSVIAKQLVDSQSLFKLLGVPNSQQISLAEVAQFFKVIVEREAHYRTQRQSEGRHTKMAHRPEDSRWNVRATFREGENYVG
ncbi:hypothetical protein BGZ63DRAFT_427967 [Mariannaea sp. PMI_226]|nr:hypothetical protein BGZ63DRAFT_427967 [Mariannaea sp. PMI_226]